MGLGVLGIGSAGPSHSTGLDSFVHSLDEFHAYAVSNISEPYENHIAEVDSLCGSIFMTQKMDKTIRKMTANLEEIQATRQVMLDKRSAEKDELQAEVCFS